jgi:hypothetical protein
MPMSTERFGRIEPRLLPCHNGTWLAVSAPGSPLRIGVAAPSEEAARQRFEEALQAWDNLWNDSNQKH